MNTLLCPYMYRTTILNTILYFYILFDYLILLKILAIFQDLGVYQCLYVMVRVLVSIEQMIYEFMIYMYLWIVNYGVQYTFFVYIINL